MNTFQDFGLEHSAVLYLDLIPCCCLAWLSRASGWSGLVLLWNNKNVALYCSTCWQGLVWVLQNRDFALPIHSQPQMSHRSLACQYCYSWGDSACRLLGSLGRLASKGERLPACLVFVHSIDVFSAASLPPETISQCKRPSFMVWMHCSCRQWSPEQWSRDHLLT